MDLITFCAPCHEEESELWRQEISSLEEVLIIKGYFASDVNELKTHLYYDTEDIKHND